MSYIGASGAFAGQAIATDVFSGNGTNTVFTLSKSIFNTKDIEVVVNNVQQNPYDGSYSVSGTTLTFSGAVSSGANNIYVTYRGTSTNLFTPYDNTVTANSIQSNAVTTAKLSDSGVTAGTYGNNTAIPVLTIDAKGRVTTATTNAVSGVTGFSYAAANATLTVSTSGSNYSAQIIPANAVIQEFSTNVTSSYTLTTGKQGLSVGPVNLANGVAVTIPSGARWVIL